MDNISFFSLFIILFNIIHIINYTNFRKIQEMENYNLFNITNINCNKSNYTTSFMANVCGKTSINSSKFFSFKIPDTKKNNHSIRCSIIIENSARKLNSILYSNNSFNIDNYDSKLENNIDEKDYILKETEKNKNDFTENNAFETDASSVFPQEKKTEDTFDSKDKSKKYKAKKNKDSTNVIKTDENGLSDIWDIETNLNVSKIEGTIPLIQIEETNEKTNEYSDIETNNFSNNVETINNSIDFEKTDISKIDPILVSKLVETTIPSTFLNEDINSNQIILQNETDIYKETSYNSTSEYCYNTFCSVEGMIKEAFEVKIEDYFTIYVSEAPEDIFIIPILIKNSLYKVNQCYLIKNIFKQVLKFKANNAQKKITFRLVSIILAKIEKNEELIADIFLKKKQGNLRFLDNLNNNTAKCKSLYNAEPVEGKEILNSYNCVINNIENPEDYSGLIFNSSSDVKNIPIDSNLTDPAITDIYIKQGMMQDYSLSEFNPINLDINNCNETSQFKILGKLSKELDDIFYFNILIFLSDDKNTTANCSLPGGIKGEINMTCQVYNYFNNSFINIPSHIIKDEDDETKLNITNIYYNINVTCQFIPINIDPVIINNSTLETVIETENETEIAQTIIISELIDSDIIFRQISHLEINSKENIIKFILIGFTFNNLKKNSYIIIPINVIKLNDIEEKKNSTCILNMDTNSNLNRLTPMIFDCEILNIEEISQVTDVKIIPFPLIKNIKTGYSEIVYANKTDTLINQGLLLDYMREENLNKVPPILINPRIISYSCYNDGTFDIEAFIESSFDKDISFYLELMELSTGSRCKIPATQANKNIIIKCNTMESFTNKKIQIDAKIAYDIDYNELFYLNNTETNNYVSCQNNQQIKMEEAKKKLQAAYSFRQASNFKKELNSNKYQFFLATFSNGEIEINSKLIIKVRIKSETQNKIKSYNKRKLSRTEDKSAECSISMKTKLNENGLGAIGWICTTMESSLKDATGLDIIDSEEISGIPNHPALIDPAKTDDLIKKGEVKDFSVEENLNELLPIFNILAMNYSLCKQNSTFIFTGNISSTILNDFYFELNISYPDTIFACRLPKALKGQIIEIECINRDNFENSTLLIEETVIRDGYNEFFIFRNISSGNLLVTCSSSENNVSERSNDNDFKIIKKTVKDESSSKIGTSELIVLIVVGAIVIFGIIMLLFFLKNKNPKKVINNNDKNSANTSGSFKNSSSISFY